MTTNCKKSIQVVAQNYRAIQCLLRAVEEDPDNLEALLDIGVSYTNELDQTQVCSVVKFNAFIHRVHRLCNT